MARRLRVMGRHSGSLYGDAMLVPLVAFSLADVDFEEERVKRRAFLARYMRQPLSELDKLTVAELRHYQDAVSELLKYESGSIALAREDT